MLLFLYAVKGCSHCDLRESCDIKNSKANLSKKMKKVDRWETFCLDFFREFRE